MPWPALGVRPRGRGRRQQAINLPIEAGERVQMPIGVPEEEGVPVDIAVGEDVPQGLDIGTREDQIGENSVAAQKEGMMMKAFKTLRWIAFDNPETAEEKKQRLREESWDNWDKQRKAEQDARSVQAYIDAQAREQATGVIDRAFDWIASAAGAGGEEYEDPSSSSAAAVQPRGRGRSPARRAEPSRPYAHTVQKGIETRGHAFTFRAKDFETPHPHASARASSLAKFDQRLRMHEAM